MGMKTPSEYLWSRRSLLLVCFVVAAILTFQAIRIWVADYRVHIDRIDQMERGVALEPENASAWDRLGRAKRPISQIPIRQQRSAIFRRRLRAYRSPRLIGRTSQARTSRPEIFRSQGKLLIVRGLRILRQHK